MGGLAQFAALSLSTVLYKPPRSGECVCVRGEHRGVLAWKKNVGKDVGGELILTLTIGLPVQTFARVGKRVAGAGWEGERRRGRKEDTDSSIASARPDWTALSSSPS